MKRSLIKVVGLFIGLIVFFTLVCGSNANLDLLRKQIRYESNQNRYVNCERGTSNCIYVQERYSNLSMDLLRFNQYINHIISDKESNSQFIVAEGDEKLPDPVITDAIQDDTIA